MSGSPSSYSVSFSGIKTQMPKSVLDKIGLTFSLLAPDIPVAIKALNSDAFTKCNESYTLTGFENTEPYAAKFSQGEVNFSIIYDKISGVPLVLSAWHGDSSVTLTVTKFKSESQ